MAHNYKLTVAPNGARRQRVDHPALPLTTADIEQTALACYQAGADEIHLHVREDCGGHSLDVARYHEAIRVITDVAPSMTIQITTESAGKFGFNILKFCMRLEGMKSGNTIGEYGRLAKGG